MLKLDVNLSLAAKVKMSNIWLLSDDEGRRFLIDSGDSSERILLRRCLANAGIKEPGDLTAVILTHRHRDHAGNAAWLRSRFECPLICHEDDRPYLEGQEKAPSMMHKQTPLVCVIPCKIQDIVPPLSKVDETYKDGDFKWGFEVFHTPGHTEGSSMLYHKPSQTLFSGDAILAGLPFVRPLKKLQLAMPGFSPEFDKCHQSVKRIIPKLPPIKRLCSGHGGMIEGDINSILAELIAPKEKASIWAKTLEWSTPHLPQFVLKRLET